MANLEERTCQNCKSQFTIEPDDFLFYERIKVPAPTFCPDCRFQRRLMFWNAINLYRRPCDLCKKFNVSVYPADAPYTVYCPKCWWSDAWDPRDYGREYDFNRPFFEQLNELWHKVPLLGLSMDMTSLQTSPYTHDVGYVKNCYLLFQALECQDSAYGYFLGQSSSMFDSTAISNCQFGYDSMHSYKTNRCIGSRNQLSESIDCLFCRDSQNCQNCFASANLKNKKYWAWNKPLSKEEYLKEVAKYDLGSYTAYREIQKKAEEHWRTQIVKSEYNEFVENCSGPNIFFSKNTKDSIEVSDCQDSRYLFRMFGPAVRDCYDVSMWGNNLSWSYECLVAGEFATQIRFADEVGLNLTDVEYCKLSTGGSHHFGCVSMKKGNNFIFNKQYTEEEYKKITARIREQMDKMPLTDKKGNVYRYGEFFPPEMTPFAYNTTLAQNFFPITQEEAKEKEYRWQDIAKEEYQTTLKASDLPDHIKDANDGILKETIACARCGRGYRIVEMELQFHRQMSVPLPRECPFCRINEKLNIWVKTNERNKRQCAACGISMESPYGIKEQPQVYCKKCYQAQLA